MTREGRRSTTGVAKTFYARFAKVIIVTRVSPLVVSLLLVYAVSSHAEQTADVDSSDTWALAKIIGEVVKPGAKVKVLRTDGTYVEGTLVSTRRLDLLDSSDGGEQTVNLGAVDKLWEMRVSKAKGEAIGGTFGLIFGVAVGIGLGLGFNSYSCDFNQDCDDADAAGAALAGAFGGGLVGGVIGLIIGNLASTGTMKWMERYPVDQSIGKSYK